MDVFAHQALLVFLPVQEEGIHEDSRSSGRLSGVREVLVTLRMGAAELNIENENLTMVMGGRCLPITHTQVQDPAVTISVP
jgi:hypothetical protein